MNDMFKELSRKRDVGPYTGLNVWDRIDASGDCWEWTAGRSHGYGHTNIFGECRGVHRAVWQALVGDIPDGLQIDHLCRNRGCCNPDHMELVTPGENSRRGLGVGGRLGKNASSKYWSGRTHCPQGHEYAGDNLISTTQGKKGWARRVCRICKRARDRKHDAKRRAR